MNKTLTPWQALACGVDFSSTVIVEKALKLYAADVNASAGENEEVSSPWLLQNRGLHRPCLPLVRAAKHSHVAVVESLLAAGAHVNGVDYTCGAATALHMAAQRAHVAMVELLLTRGADVHALSMPRHSDECVTTLEMALSAPAAESSVTRVVLMLLAHGASVHGSTKLGSLLHLAVHMKCSTTCMTALLQAGVDASRRDVHGRTALLLLTERVAETRCRGQQRDDDSDDDNRGMLLQLLWHTQGVDAPCHAGYNALELAASSRAHVTAATLVYAGARRVTAAGIIAAQVNKSKLCAHSPPSSVIASLLQSVAAAAMARRMATLLHRRTVLQQYHRRRQKGAKLQAQQQQA